MSSSVDAKSIEANTREALIHFVRELVDITAPIGVEAFAQGPAHDEAVDLVRGADDVFGQDVSGKIATVVDRDGLDVGDAHVRTQLVLFAQGKVLSPIAEITLVKTRTIPVASTVKHSGAIAATCTLTTILTYESSDSEGQRVVNTAAKIGFNLEYTSPKKSLALQGGPL